MIIGSFDTFKDLRSLFKDCDYFSLNPKTFSSLSTNHVFMFLLLDENAYVQCTLSKFSIVDLEDYYHYSILFPS